MTTASSTTSSTSKSTTPSASSRSGSGSRRANPTPPPDTGTGPAAEAKLRAVHDRLTAAIADLTSAENWQLMLRTAAKLPTYSPHNVLLITTQCPEASAVAGFHTWKQLGRAVRKGEKGIAILAPVLRRPARESGAADRSGDTSPAGGRSDRGAGSDAGEQQGTAAGGGGRRVVGFRVVHVFDIGQTDGPDLPAPPRPELLAGQAPPGLLDGLTTQVTQAGYQLLRHNFDIPHPGVGVPNGVTDHFARTVIVRPDLSDAQTTKTLAHELGHVLLHEPGRRPADLTREQAEVEAESVAHVVAAAHGMDTSGYTIPYVAGWSGGNLELLARSAERVVATAHQILALTPPPPTFELTDTGRGADRNRDTERADGLVAERESRGPVVDLSDRGHAARGAEPQQGSLTARQAESPAAAAQPAVPSTVQPVQPRQRRDEARLRTSADQQRQGQQRQGQQRQGQQRQGRLW